MNTGLRFRRAVTGVLAGRGYDSRITRAIVSRTCAQRGVACRFESGWIALREGETEIRLPLRQALFAPYVADHFDTFAKSVAAEQTSVGRLVDFSEPKVHRYLQLDADFELPSFPEAIDFDAEYFRFGAPAPGALVFDLGANVGLVTHALSRAVGPSGRVIAFEPDPTSREYLERNNARHSLGNVTVTAQAVASAAGSLEFFAEGTITSGLATTRQHAVMTKSLGSTIAVEAVTLAEAFSTYGRPAWVKMDIEGAEIDVLDGARELLRDTRPFLVIDTSHVVGADTSAARVEAILQSVGYATETRSPGGAQLTWARYGSLSA